ncbi:MAG: hypothetical protein KFBDDELM_00036 [Candidatus Argoarchaeum ethanivorans]|uniref:DUF2206 domain-containing protein n=1 Tax=Candidatus Argoarchaeum ethanivorans TaxID=2608793 RepID=A0A811T4J6_9EURY|nr:MAG: hypothetical protein KFBDDELM_00036 [Candidatus Argoarchaeum ethanivorans]
MQINNPLQMNDWEIKRFLKVVLAIQLMILGVIGLDTIGLQIPIMRQLIGFVYLTFIPGIIVIRILKLHKLGSIETLLYMVGLSIATLMFTGLFMNTVYPFFGISGPISITPLIITISILVLILCILSYVRDKDYSNPSFIDVGEILSPPVLFLCLIPFLAVFGTYLVNFQQDNILLMFLIIILALIAVSIAFDKFIPKNLYPLAVFVIAISLLYHSSLISMYIWGWDIHHELYLTNLVKMNSIWDSTMRGGCNAMLSLVMLAPIYSIISNMSITWVFKIIYPLLFSLVPLGLYRVFQKQTNDKIAFLSCFFFVSLFIFYTEMLALARQQIAELFLVLLILVMIDKNMDKMKRSLLSIVFGISLALSHYGLSYIYMFCLIFAWLILVFVDSSAAQKLRNTHHSKFSGYKREKLAGNPISSNAKNRTISSTFVLLFIVFMLTWYMYVSSSSAFNSIVRIGDHIASSIFTDLLNPEVAEGWRIIMGETVSPLHSVTKYLHLLSQFFIVIGILTLMLKRSEMKFEKEYTAFTAVNFVICFVGIAVPYFASSLATTRLYHITLFFLAPFCAMGGITFLRTMSRVVRTSWTNESVRSSPKVLSVFLAIFLLFNTGFVYEVAEDIPTSISLNSTIDYPRFNHQEVLGAEWLNNVKNSNPIYADEYRRLLVGRFEWGQVRTITTDVDRMRRDSYIYLGSLTIEKKEIMVVDVKSARRITREYINSNQIINDKNKIYNNGGAQVYWD